ncbi:MAG: DUF2059 domain-containing protein [Blastocatellia bacterium]
MANRFLAGLMALAFCFIIALPAHAQDALTPEKKALIKELMKLMNAATNTEALTGTFLEQSLNNIAPLISQGLLQEIPQEKLSPDEQKRLKSEADAATQRILIRLRTEFPKRINFGELLERAGMEMYGKHFTEEELKELIAFHKTPVAQKLLRLLPQITAETMPKIVEWVTPTFTQLMDEVFIEEKNKFKTR